MKIQYKYKGAKEIYIPHEHERSFAGYDMVDVDFTIQQDMFPLISIVSCYQDSSCDWHTTSRWKKNISIFTKILEIDRIVRIFLFERLQHLAIFGDDKTQWTWMLLGFT